MDDPQRTRDLHVPYHAEPLRQRPGVVPTFRRNVSLKCAWLEKPKLSAISVNVRVGSLRIAMQAASILRSTTYA